MRRTGIAALVALTACGHSQAPHFNRLPSGAASAPASAVSAPPEGSSDLTITGEVAFTATTDFQCTEAHDDFFVRGSFPDYQGIPMYLSVNVEFYKGPGRYVRKTQVLVRRIAKDATTFYASWALPTASSTVLPGGRGLDLDVATLPPEAGTDAKRPVRFGGHVGCLPK